MNLLIAQKNLFKKRLESDFEFANYLIRLEGYNFEISEGCFSIQLKKEINSEKNEVENAEKGCFVRVFLSGEIELQIDNLNAAPLFFAVGDNDFVITDNCLEFQNVSFLLERDWVGFIQRLSGPDHSSIGERTLIKNVFRCVPNKNYRLKNGVVSKKDLSVFQYGNEPLTRDRLNAIRTALFESHQKIWDDFNTLDVALSGGLDSRVSLGIFADLSLKEQNKGKGLRAVTYGAYWNYETRIAEKLAFNLSVLHTNIWDDNACWPTIGEIHEYVKKSGSFGVSSWNNLKRYYKSKTAAADHCLIMGDLLEALAGRKLSFGLTRIQKFTSKLFRYRAKALDDKSLNNCKYKIKESFKKSICNTYLVLAESIGTLEISLDEVLEQTFLDLDLMFKDCLRFGVREASQFFEVFQWILYSQSDYRNQAGYFRGIIAAESPGCDQKVLAEVARIRPIDRMDSNLLLSLIKSLECYSKLNVPTANAPFVKISKRLILKNFSNFCRVVLDNHFKKARRTDRNTTKKMAMLKGVNWPKVYSLFPTRNYANLLSADYCAPMNKIVHGRAKLKTQPLVNYDVMNWIFVSELCEVLLNKDRDID